MEESILLSVKKLLGIMPDYTAFDTDIIIHINTALGILYQLGIGEKYFVIMDSTETWSDFLPADEQNLSLVKSYVFLKVKMLFDPPTASASITAYNNLINELEFRINVAVDPKRGGEESGL